MYTYIYVFPIVQLSNERKRIPIGTRICDTCWIVIGKWGAVQMMANKHVIIAVEIEAPLPSKDVNEGLVHVIHLQR